MQCSTWATNDLFEKHRSCCRLPRKYSRSSWGNQQLPESLLKQAVTNIPHSQATLEAPVVNLDHNDSTGGSESEDMNSKAWKCLALLNICGSRFDVREAFGASKEQAQHQAALNALHK
jgi:hypothetical protein